MLLAALCAATGACPWWAQCALLLAELAAAAAAASAGSGPPQQQPAAPPAPAPLPRRRGSAECELCQLFVAVGVQQARPGGVLEAAADLCGAPQCGGEDWASLAAEGGAGELLGEGEVAAACAALRRSCEAFWAKEGERASGGLDTLAALLARGFLASRAEMCLQSWVCNAYTAWDDWEVEAWHALLRLDLELAEGSLPSAAGAAVADEPAVGPGEGAPRVAAAEPAWLDAALDALGGGTAAPEPVQAERRAAAGAAAAERAARRAASGGSALGAEVAGRASPREAAAGAGAVGGARPAAQPVMQAARPAGPPGDPLSPACPPPYKDDYSDLQGTRVVAVVFSGRGSRLRILFPYLRRDLRANGGVIDRIICALIRPDEEALRLIAQMKGLHGAAIEVRDYTEAVWGRSVLDPSQHRMAHLYSSLNESDTVYIKIDDDIAYVARHAVAELVREKLRGRCLFVSANVVNHAILSAIHQERGAHRAFEPPPEFDDNPSARLPWTKVGDVNFDPSYTFERHPMSSCVLKRWDCAAIAHESFLDRQREGTLCAFDFGWLDFNRAGFREHTYVHLSPWAGQTWEARGARWSINFFAFRREDMVGVDWSRVYGPGDDEEEFGGSQGERRQGHACALGRSLVVHFSYNTQEERLLALTRLLDRYAALAAGVSSAEGGAAEFALPGRPG